MQLNNDTGKTVYCIINEIVTTIATLGICLISVTVLRVYVVTH